MIQLWLNSHYRRSWLLFIELLNKVYVVRYPYPEGWQEKTQSFIINSRICFGVTNIIRIFATLLYES